MTGKGKARAGAKTSHIYEATQETAFTVGNDVFPESRDGKGQVLKMGGETPTASEGQGDTVQPSVSRPIGIRNICRGRCWTECV